MNVIWRLWEPCMRKPCVHSSWFLREWFIDVRMMEWSIYVQISSCVLTCLDSTWLIVIELTHIRLVTEGIIWQVNIRIDIMWHMLKLLLILLLIVIERINFYLWIIVSIVEWFSLACSLIFSLLLDRLPFLLKLRSFFRLFMFSLLLNLVIRLLLLIGWLFDRRPSTTSE